MKKRKLANLIMVAVIVVIAAGGLFTVGHIQGWFDHAGGDAAVLTEHRGNLTLERDGVAFPATGQTVLRSGDRLSTGSGATAVIRTGSGTLTLGGKTEVEIRNPATDGFEASVNAGEVFVSTMDSMTLLFADNAVVLADCVASLSVRTGAQSIYVYDRSVEFGGKTAEAGQQLSFLGDSTEVSSLSVSALNDFLTDQVRKTSETRSLCFTLEDLDRLSADRQQALQDLLNSQTQPSDPVQTQPVETLPQETQPTQTEPAATKPTDPPAPTETRPTETKPPETKPTDPPPATTVPATTAPATEPAPTDPSETEPVLTPAGSCVITIRCDTILDNMDRLASGKAEFVPADGVILPAVTVQFYTGETVFDVLKRVCEAADIQMEYVGSTKYGSCYIEGINHLYEFDCGDESGWMYKVNEWFPNYGCSSYEVSDGDVIVWCYTCNGYGADVGA